MQFDTYIFDLYGTLVDIHTDEEKNELWEKMALFYGYYGAYYEPKELQKEYARLVSCGEKDLAKALTESEQSSQSLSHKDISHNSNPSSIEKKDDVHESHPEIKLEYVFQKLYEQKGIKADIQSAIHTGQFFRVLSTDYIRLYDGAKELLTALKEAGKKVYLLSNAQRIFTEYEIRSLGIFEYFDDIFISSECGVKKPDSRFFNLLLTKHRIDPKKAVMIGNDLVSDIDGAKRVGLSTFYIHSNISPKLSKEWEDMLSQIDMHRNKKTSKQTAKQTAKQININNYEKNFFNADIDKTEKIIIDKTEKTIIDKTEKTIKKELPDFYLGKMNLSLCKKILLDEK